MFPMYPKSHHTDIYIVPILYSTRNLLSVLKWTIKQIVLSHVIQKNVHMYIMLFYAMAFVS